MNLGGSESLRGSEGVSGRMKMPCQKEPNTRYGARVAGSRIKEGSIALYGVLRDEVRFMLPWSVQVLAPESREREVARPIDEVWDPKVETE